MANRFAFCSSRTVKIIFMIKFKSSSGSFRRFNVPDKVTQQKLKLYDISE